MRYVYFVVPDLSYAGHARQVSMLAPGMNRADGAVGVYSLAGDGPFGAPLRAANVPVERLMGSAARDLGCPPPWMIPLATTAWSRIWLAGARRLAIACRHAIAANRTR